MATKKEQQGQKELFAVGPKQSAKLNAAIEKWKGKVAEWTALGKKVAVAKDEALKLFKAENLSRLEDGSTQCRCEGWKLRLAPTEEKFTATPLKD